METLSYHSNQSSYPPGIKNTNYVEATVRTCIQSTGLIPLTVSEKKILNVFRNFALYGAQQPIKIKDYHKSHMKCRGLLNKHFCKNKIQMSAILAEK